MEQVLADTKKELNKKKEPFTEKHLNNLAENFNLSSEVKEAINKKASDFVKGKGSFEIENNGNLYFIPKVTETKSLTIEEQKPLTEKVSIFKKFLQAVKKVFRKEAKQPQSPQPQLQPQTQLIVNNLTLDKINLITEFNFILKKAKEEGIIAFEGVQLTVKSLRENTDSIIPSPRREKVKIIISNVLEKFLEYDYSMNIEDSVTEAINAAFNVYSKNPNYKPGDPNFEAAIEIALKNVKVKNTEVKAMPVLSAETEHGENGAVERLAPVKEQVVERLRLPIIFKLFSWLGFSKKNR